MRHQKNTARGTQQPGRAAIFVDYENLFALLLERLDRRGFADELITEMLDELRHHLLNETHTRAALTNAYADFGELGGNGHFIQRTLFLQGVEPRFVPANLQSNAVEIQLCVDAMDVLHHRPDIETFVLVTGNRAYLPLVQQFRRYGRQVLVAALENPPPVEGVQYVEGDFFVDATSLLSEASRRDLSASPAPAADSAAPHPPAPATVKDVTDPILEQTLEVVDEFFGHYEEVYLTPLLRKLSEIFDEQRHDPKELIGELEQAGAVRLEKRRGHPYDYTVLIVNLDHPAVERARAAVAARPPLPDDDTDDDAEFDDTEYDTETYYDDEPAFVASSEDDTDLFDHEEETYDR